MRRSCSRIAAVLVLLVPDLLLEGRAAELLARELALLEQLLLDHGLRGDAGVVGARHPQRVVAAHAPVTDHDVLDRVVEPVAHVQDAGHVGRRDHDREGRLLQRRRVAAGGRAAAGLPQRADAGLDRGRLVAAGHLGHGCSSPPARVRLRPLAGLRVTASPASAAPATAGFGRGSALPSTYSSIVWPSSTCRSPAAAAASVKRPAARIGATSGPQSRKGTCVVLPARCTVEVMWSVVRYRRTLRRRSSSASSGPTMKRSISSITRTLRRTSVSWQASLAAAKCSITTSCSSSAATARCNLPVQSVS